MFDRWRKTPRYSKLESGNDKNPKGSIRVWLVPMVILLLCALSFGAGWMAGAAGAQPSTFPDIIPSLPVTGLMRQQVLTQPEMQAAPPANGSHEPAWDKLIPNGLGYVKHRTLAPELSVIGVFHQLHCLYTVRRAYYAAYAASVGQEFNRAGVREPGHISHCLDYLQQSLICNADIGIEPFYAGHLPDIMFGRQCRDFSEIQAWATEWRVMNGSGFIFDSKL
ncbi:hypothetical protein F5Y04DRAFT_286247 [Hypomontagnella monticulosa]|nr:hypothetical protein F5Y04DRAFT_286247 [Hypomontagnella monticulosa]